MKIAICLSGQPRTWRHTYNSLFSYFSGHEIDIFLHLWDEVSLSERQELCGAYRPIALRITERPLFLSAKKVMAKLFPVAPAFNAFDMFYGVSAALELALGDERSAGYDLFCRSRFDAIFDGRWSGDVPPAGAIVTQAGQITLEGGANDQFALGDRGAMVAYAGISAWLPVGMTRLSDIWFRPEMALQYYLSSHCRLKVIPESIPFKLLRDEHVGRAFEELDDDPMFHARKHEEWSKFAQTHFRGEVAEGLDFEHYAQMPLTLDRWLENLPAQTRQLILHLDWPQRIAAIDQLLAEQTGGLPMDAERHRLVRLVCAALIHRMERNEPFGCESFIVHALSANTLDVDRAKAWVEEFPSGMESVRIALRNVPILDAAMGFVPWFEQETIMGWRLK